MNTPNQPDKLLRELFLRALEIHDLAARAQFLNQACAGREHLRKEIETLLANDRDDSFLRHPAVHLQADPGTETFKGNPEASLPGATINPGGKGSPGSKIHYFGDYEILHEIARGGMGVVYKARQKSLNRIVALKMIRAGRLADEADLQRFRTEAEAAANLQHPNIVAIHEIGEHEGQHYFSMDYVEGKDLAQLATGSPLPTARAAHCVKLIAEAIEYAHRQGTLHRDLKPHNVLIGPQDQPRITDFGLAKISKQDSALTQEGAVLGSPSYMPPEQAAGKLNEIGPASDVYSIGAVLYHLLTGRAPFSAETAIATMRKVLEDEPVPPSKLNSKVPEDLETICLKCLQKTPSQRYSSAQELVDELGRFLNFEPIRAHPASNWRRGWSWLQRNPWIFAGGLGSLVMIFGTIAYAMFERARYLSWHLTSGETRTSPLEDSPCILFFKVLPILFLLLYQEAKMFRRGYRKRLGDVAQSSNTALWIHGGLGLAVVAFGMVSVILQIKAWAWSSSITPLIFLELGGVQCAAILSWVGFHRIWETIGMHETSRFREVVDKSLERQLALEWQRWSTVKLAGFAVWLIITIWAVLLLLVVCIGLSSNLLGGAIALLGLGGFVGMVQWIGWVVRERKRLFTWLYMPLVLGAFTFGLGALTLGSHPASPSRVEPQLVFAVFLAGLFAAALVSMGRAYFKRAMDEDARRPFPGKLWLDSCLGLGFLVIMGALLIQIENWRGAREWNRVKAVLAAKGESVEYEAFRKPSVPPEENVMAHPYMKKHFLKGTPVFPVAIPNVPTDLAGLRTVQSLQEILDWHKQSSREFDQLEEALRRPQSRVEADPARIMAMPIPNFVSLRNAVQAYEQRCKVQLLLGDADGAFQSLQWIRRLLDAGLFNEPPFLAGTMWKIKATRVCAATIEETLSARLWPTNYLERVQQLSDGLNPIADLGRGLRFGERVGILLWGSSLGKGLTFGGAGDLPWFSGVIPNGWIALEFAHYAEAFQYCLEGLDTKNQRFDVSSITQAEAELKKVQSKFAFSHFLAQVAIPSGISKAHRETARAQTLVDQARIAAALERFHAAKGAYPETLQELLPQFTAALPHDCLDGQPLRYRRMPNGGYLLYSIGWNNRDDGGQQAPEKDSEGTDGDWVWRGVPAQKDTAAK